MSDPIPEEKLAEWEALAKAATPGPWEVIHGDNLAAGGWDLLAAAGSVDQTTLAQRAPHPNRSDEMRANGDLMAAFREAVPALIAEVRRLRRFHAPTCNVILDDESDAVLDDYQTCTCGVRPPEWP